MTDRGNLSRAIVASGVLSIALLVNVTCDGSKPPAPASAAVPSAPSDSTTDVRPAACSLLSRTEMSAILGGELAEPYGREDVGSTACRYPPHSETSLVYADVSIEWEAGDAAMRAARGASQTIESTVDASIADPLAGVGDDALILVGSIVMVRSGETVITIDLRLQPDARAKGAAIARQLIERINAS